MGTGATASCSLGYSQSGSQVRTCESNGHWTGDVTTCIQGDKFNRLLSLVLNESIFISRNSSF